MNKALMTFAFLSLSLAGASSFSPAYAAATVTELGDLSSLHSIVADSQALASSGDLTGAATRITDFESAWDANASRLRALSSDKWGVIDDASDAALAALRTAQPAADDVNTTLTSLIAVLDNPSAAPMQVAAVTAVTDANGRPLPCEDLLAEVRASAAATPVADANKSQFEELQAKGIERCNADDDKRADDFFAQALALAGK